ncbi:MAG: PilZ domain-containing protein [Gammaproteobacteria bacterium]|nr:PilZ domain-containing protein [Gammaproteobacteria bacterium]MCG3142897.1 Cyclic diguanosine monophosphate-binding protein [Gammaproteobacteria bacterium]
MSTGNKRHFQRIPLQGEVTITDPGTIAHARLVDLSLKGALTGRPSNWSPVVGADCRLAIRLEGAEAPVVMECRVAHVGEDHIGFACHHIDIDSITFLRRMVELNIGDPALLERELSSLG